MDQLQPSPPRSNQGVGDLSRVEEVLRAFSTALRSFRLYGGDGSSVDRFIAPLRQRISELWLEQGELKLTVDEHRFLCGDQVVFPAAGEAGELPFLFYKDGIRELTLLPGFEDEVVAFVGVVARASQIRNEEDDLVTLLWEEELGSVRCRVVELGGDTAQVGRGSGEPPAPVDAGSVRGSAAAPPEPEDRGFTPDDFEEALHFLDEGELRTLAGEVRAEAERDLWGDVLSALFDLLEDGDAERQVRIITILGELLPSMLGAGRLDRAASMLQELVQLAARPDFLPTAALRQVRSLIGELSNPETIDQLVLTLEDEPEALRGDDLTTLLGFFPPQSLAPLMRAVDGAVRPDVRRVLEQAVERLATSHRDTVVALLADPDPALVAGAAGWAGRLQVGKATPELLRLLGDPSTPVRLAAIDALQEIRAATAGGALVGLLDDDEREVRVAAARALGALEYAAARKALESVVSSKQIRGADRTEKIAFFEAYGRLAGQEAVALLDRILNGKGWLGKAETSEIRACAALGLARVRHPSAREALAGAASDDDPVVRSAVARALRGEAT